MPSDKNDPTDQTSDDASGDAERASAENASGPNGHLTHAQRVERVNAYLQSAASKGVWSAIE